MLMLPPNVQPGDKIALVAPARKISSEELQFSIEFIQKQGFEPVLAPHLYGVHHQYSGTDQERLSDMQWAIDQNEIKVVLAVRGGYGCLRWIDQLDLTRFLDHPKWIIGYSDLTVVHAKIVSSTPYASLHATMPLNFHKDEKATLSLFQAIKGEPMEYTFEANGSLNMASVSGKLVGGNLSLLYAMIGSSTDTFTDDCILFLEDLDEYLYHLDRMLLSMKRSGKLSKLKALLVGSFTDLKDNSIAFGKTIEEIIAEHTSDFNYPVFFNFPAGHQDRNYAIKLGAMASLEPQQNGTILFKQ